MNRRAVLYFAVVLVLVLGAFAGCSKKNAVGSGVKVGDKGGQGGFLGQTSTTAAINTTSTAAVNTTTTKKATVTTQRATTTTAAAAPTLVIKIQSSTASGGAFDPAAGVTVPRGALVRWQNNDSQARSVIADDNSFASPSIAPGAFFDYTVTRPGRVSYHDGTRPFAVGSFDVQ